MTSRNGKNKRGWSILRGIENMKDRMSFADMINERGILKKFPAALGFILFPPALAEVPQNLPQSGWINIP